MVLILEYCGVRNLLQFLNKHNKSLDERTTSGLVRQALTGYAALHAADIYHLDVKLTNLMLMNDTVKIIDFGLSAMKNRHVRWAAGADGYFAREIYLGRTYLGYKADMWSLGSAAYRLLFGLFPFGLASENSEKFYANLKLIKYSFPEKKKVSEELKDFFEKIFVPEAYRWTASQLLEHPWITKFQ